MPRARASVPPEAIRIEDEVWQEAFRETTRSPSRARLRSLDGGLAADRLAPDRPDRPARPLAAKRRAIAPPDFHPAPVQAAVLGRPEPRELAPEAPVRRTVTITGRGAERNLPWPTESSRRRAARRPHERAGFKPDRVAMWAVFLGLLLVLVAAASGHA
jgi:hypothetical protein